MPSSKRVFACYAILSEIYFIITVLVQKGPVSTVSVFCPNGKYVVLKKFQSESGLSVWAALQQKQQNIHKYLVC